MEHFPFELLQLIEDKWVADMPEASKDRLKFLKRELKFLDIFLSLQSFTDRRDVLDVTHKVEALFKDAAIDLRKVNKIQHIDRVTAKVQETIRLTKVEIRDEYSFPIVSSNNDGIAAPKFVMEFIDTVVSNLDDLQFCVSNRLEDVIEESKLLRNFVCFVSDLCIEPRSQHTNFFTHVLVVVGHAAMIAWLYLPNENQELMNVLRMKMKPFHSGTRKVYINVLQAVKSTIQSGWHPNIPNKDVAVRTIQGFGKTLANYLETLKQNFRDPQRGVGLTEQIDALKEMLNRLIVKLNRLSTQDLESHLQEINTVMVDSGLLIYTLYDSIEKNEAVASGDLRGNIQKIEIVICHIIRKDFQSNLPKIHGLGYVDFVLNNLKEFQNRYSDSLAFVKTELQIIQTELESLQPFLKSVAKEQHNNKIQHSVALLIGKAYEVEYVVDVCISKNVPCWYLKCWLQEIIEEIRAEKANIPLNKVSEIDVVLDNAHLRSELARTSWINDEVVGFEDVIETLRCQLIQGGKDLDVISIVGITGAGKTALAKRLYFDESIVAHFEIFAQCCVSRDYSKRSLLLSILGMLPGVCEDTETKELANTLRRTLHSKRCLIVIDGIYDTTAWDYLRDSFCDSNNGSRILLTTQDSNVANYAISVSKPLGLRELNDDESWELLKKKVFGEERCSPLLENVGKKIARKCKGLPLSIVFVASKLAGMEKTEKCWKQVVWSLGSDIPCCPEDIIEQSYHNLPYHLKSCFLYFGMFSYQEEINISKLTLLWIGEGFIKHDDDKSLEDIAEGYLENLVERYLVVLAKRSCGGKVKLCCTHDIWFNFCKERAQKENLIRRIERYQAKDSYSPKQLVQGRVAFYAEIDNFKEWSKSCSLVGSVLFREASTNTSSSISQVFHIFHNFKFLKVLDLECIVIHSFPTDLFYLRYIAAHTNVKSIPLSIDTLWNLETLMLKRSKGNLSIPTTVWKMAKLRHLQISPCFTTELLDHSELYDLRTISTPYFSCVENAVQVLRKIPNIRELTCKFEGVSRGHFPVLNFPAKLETLHIFAPLAEVPSLYPVFMSASNLKKLTLTRFRLSLRHLSNIAQNLENLQALELDQFAFDDEKCGEEETSLQINDEFPQLKVLKLSRCYLKELTVSDDTFPNLQCLFLHYCKLLEGIPSCFEDIYSLKYIEIEYCNESVVSSAKVIQEKQRENYQNHDFELFIKSSNFRQSADD